jgi:hypothetical protein
LLERNDNVNQVKNSLAAGRDASLHCQSVWMQGCGATLVVLVDQNANVNNQQANSGNDGLY